MFCLRSIARSAPRSASSLASYSTRTALRPALGLSSRFAIVQLSRCQAVYASPFSTSRTLRDDAAQELAAKLSSEIQLESEDHETSRSESDTNVKNFLDQGIWSLHDADGGQEVKLSRKYEDESIDVSFSIVDFNTPGMEPQEDMDEALMDEDEDMDTQSGGASTKGAVNQGKTDGGNFKVAPEDDVSPADRDELRNEEDDSQPAFPANVNVMINRPNKGGLRVNLVTDSGEFTIQSVTHLASGDVKDMETTYSGPPFQQLDEEVQSLLESYLNERGINTELAMFIPEYIDVKEQKEYLGWLKRVQQFVE